MKTIDDVLARLDGEGVAMVVQLSAKECAEMAAVIRENRDPVAEAMVAINRAADKTRDFFALQAEKLARNAAAKATAIDEANERRKYADGDE